MVDNFTNGRSSIDATGGRRKQIFAACVKTKSRDLNISYGCIRVFGACTEYSINRRNKGRHKQILIMEMV